MSIIDHANLYLLQALKEAPAGTLWWVDENIVSIPSPHQSQQAITNRYDLYTELQRKKWDVQFSDFDTQHLSAASLNCVILRLPKEKALVHFLINQSAHLLRTGGELWLIGDKSEGIRGFNKRAATRLGGTLKEHKVSGGLWVAKITSLPSQAGGPLDDQNYTELREINDSSGFAFISKPGIYGWQKVDPGSDFLHTHLSDMLQQPLPLLGRVLDLGCGYGYLSMQAAGSETHLTCTDNSAAALACCQANLKAHSITATVMASDAGDTVHSQYDTILCNPPFHSGFATNSDLTERFIATTARCLQMNGQACFVVNKHIGLEHKARSYFGKIKLFAENNHFKLVHLSQPKHR